MFSRIEIKAFIVKLGGKWFFPNFNNKLTWYVVTLGASIILTPTPLKLVLYNWLIETINLNSGVPFSMVDIGEISADYWLGFGLIITALFHNVFSKWLLCQEYIFAQANLNKISEADIKLFEKFLSTFPTNSRAVSLLESHDFGGSFNLDSLKELDDFVYYWNTPENAFLNSEVELQKVELWGKCKEFSQIIGRKSGPTRSGRQSVVPEEILNAWDWPKEVDEDVRIVNEMGTEVFLSHQNFIKSTRNALKC